MKTIIKGNPNVAKEIKYFKCKRCGWVGSAEKGEYKSETQYNETEYWVKCPCCKYLADEVTDPAEIALYAAKPALIREPVYINPSKTGQTPERFTEITCDAESDEEISSPWLSVQAFIDDFDLGDFS